MSNTSRPKIPRRFKKPRRASLACLSCRKRKIKCVSVEDSYDRPCTRCAQHRRTCEFLSVSDQHSVPSRRKAPQPHPDDSANQENSAQLLALPPPGISLSGANGAPAPDMMDIELPVGTGRLYPGGGSQSYTLPIQPHTHGARSQISIPSIGPAAPSMHAPYRSAMDYLRPSYNAGTSYNGDEGRDLPYFPACGGMHEVMGYCMYPPCCGEDSGPPTVIGWLPKTERWPADIFDGRD